MNQIERIQVKIRQIEQLCAEVIEELDTLDKKPDSHLRKPTGKEVVLPTEAECLADFDRMYSSFLSGNSQIVREFVQEKSGEYLRVFCKANNLPIDTKKTPKKRIADEILQWLAQRKAILGDASKREEDLVHQRVKTSENG
jgi:hypothetical protein